MILGGAQMQDEREAAAGRVLIVFWAVALILCASFWAGVVYVALRIAGIGT